MTEKVNIKEKLSLFSETWTPKIIGECNGQYIKLARAKGEFVWHKHDHEDEFFMCLEGQMTIELRDGEVILNPGEFYIVPKGVEHKPHSTDGCATMLFEPKSIAHTGDVKSELTVEQEEWI